ncbi:hypothetical protein HUJ04_007403 [Dendroctonus ponderosae]|nr:hypothetical protein HUJ04_007403 [Dendroctonus ponderosae]
MPRKLEQEIDLTNALELQTHRLEQRRKIVNCAWQTKGICLGKNKRQIKGIRAKIPLYTTRDLDVAPKGPLKMSFLAPVSLYYIERKAVKHFHANIIECVQLELVAQNVSKQINILRLTQSLDKSTAIPISHATVYNTFSHEILKLGNGSGFRCYHCHQTSKKCNNGDLDEIHQKNCSQRKCTVMKYETPVPGRKVLATIRDCASSTEHDLLRMVSVELKTPAKTLKREIEREVAPRSQTLSRETFNSIENANPGGSGTIGSVVTAAGAKPKRTQCQTDLTSYAYVKKPLSISRSKDIDEQMLRWIVKGFHAFRIVEEDEFLKLCDMLCPNYQVPSRKTISNSLLQQQYESRREKIEEELEKIHKFRIAANSELFRINRAIHWNQTISGFGTTLYINIAYGIAEIAKYRILSGLGRT